MNILDISKSNPVVLSDVSVPSGDYEQLRLVIKNNATIVVDDVSYDIKIPSGEQSGVKLDGNFSIRGKFFRLDLDFIPEESVIYNKGQGYILKPVIKIADIENREILGYFRGELGGREAVIALYDNNTFTAKTSMYPDKEIYGEYLYNSVSKVLELKNMEVFIEIKDWFGFVWYSGRKKIKELNNEIVDPVYIPVKQWSLDSIIAIDSKNNNEISFNKINDFNFKNNYTFTKLKIEVIYPDNSKSGKDIVVEIIPYNQNVSSYLEFTKINGNKGIVIFNIENSDFIINSNIEFKVIAYLFDEEFNKGIFPCLSNNKITMTLSGAYFSEITDNPWQKEIVVKVEKNQNNEKTIEFPKRLNIKMTPDDWSTNNPIISWDIYPGAEYGYIVMVLVEDKFNNIENDNDGNNVWDIVFYSFVRETSIELFSDKYFVKNPFNYEDQTLIRIKSGDLVRVEVIVLDGSKVIDLETYSGALYMDSKNFIRN